MSVMQKKSEMEILSHLRAGSTRPETSADTFSGSQRGMSVTYNPLAIERATIELGVIAQRLAPPECDEPRAPQDPAGQDALVQSLATALRTFDKAQVETGIRPDALVELATTRGLFSCIETGAGQIKARGLEGLLQTESYSWVLINKTLSYVKAQFKSAKTDEIREAVLGQWASVLSLIGQELEQMREEKGATRQGTGPS